MFSISQTSPSSSPPNRSQSPSPSQSLTSTPVYPSTAHRPWRCIKRSPIDKGKRAVEIASGPRDACLGTRRSETELGDVLGNRPAGRYEMRCCWPTRSPLNTASSRKPNRVAGPSGWCRCWAGRECLPYSWRLISGGFVRPVAEPRVFGVARGGTIHRRPRRGLRRRRRRKKRSRGTGPRASGPRR